MERYKTVAGQGGALYIEKKSKFIAAVSPVHSEDEAQQFIAGIRKKYWDAGHNVFAYQIGLHNEIQRQSDDGEPSGTGGAPIIELLKTNDIRNTVIVVTRYFGGILLGVGGLTRAYGQAAKEGLANAKIIEKILYKNLLIELDYTLWGRVQHETQKQNYRIDNVEYLENIYVSFWIEPAQEERFIKKLADITKGQAKIEYGRQEYL